MRIKSGVTTRAHKKKYFKLAKGNYSAKRTRWRMVKQQVEASLAESYIGRKDKKGTFRSLWIERINAACRMNDTTYSRFINGLTKAGITLNRKMLSEMAVRDGASFRKLVSLAQGA
ncbi:MAG TPA: 50S ribosomal protein L20 [Elusimicrobia bacterium]|nr:MAG: 50S ribosomal protein L20 [Elusimicrobia bacterium GWA2_66_18]OGR71357.1 MAG: 50S ribosomal protein L20 [Elusimicrobia bacterium GWC2_65_9]HAZ07421.1 50S ribosomal protein L20 [Elusimicrobiota bacterium]